MLDLTGKTYGKLTAMFKVRSDYRHNHVWLFHCACGTMCEKPASPVSRGNVKSCGCLHREMNEKRRTKPMPDYTIREVNDGKGSYNFAVYHKGSRLEGSLCVDRKTARKQMIWAEWEARIRKGKVAK